MRVYRRHGHLTPLPSVNECTDVALAGFANFASIVIQIGTRGSLRPEMRSAVAKVGPYALLTRSLANLENVEIAGVVLSLSYGPIRAIVHNPVELDFGPAGDPRRALAALAQLVERFTRNEKVVSSILTSGSTNY